MSTRNPLPKSTPSLYSHGLRQPHLAEPHQSKEERQLGIATKRQIVESHHGSVGMCYAANNRNRHTQFAGINAMTPKHVVACFLNGIKTAVSISHIKPHAQAANS